MQKIGILGIGKLGLCYALNLEQNGYSVLGIDVNNNYVDTLNNKTFISNEPQVNELLKEAKSFNCSNKINDVLVDEIDVIFVMVATPSLADGSYDHSQIEGIAEELIQNGERNNRVCLVIGCTTMPGYCKQLSKRLKPLNYEVCYNPEFIAQGSIIKDQQFPDQILIGAEHKDIGDRIAEINLSIVKNKPSVHTMDLTSAEITKLATNCFITTKIAFANAVGDLALKTGADYNKILSAVGSDSRIGKKFLNYGFGFGGPCLPRDNRALAIFADQNNFDWKIGKATDDSNKSHLLEMKNAFLSKYKEDEIIEFNYITYKKESTLLDESQQLLLAIELTKAGRKVKINERKEIINILEKVYPGFFILNII
jgi:UDPglucose 6-dehydrogenase